MFIPILVMFSLLLVTSSASDAQVQDFCVANLTIDTPSGYACKDVTEVTADDFLFSLAGNGTTNTTSQYTLTPAYASDFPGVNGLQLSLARVDIAADGIFPVHTHPRGNELFTVISGTILASFTSTNTTVYSRTLNEWDTFVFPQGLPHFLINTGGVPAVGLASLSSSRPGLEFNNVSLLGDSLASKVVGDDSHIED